VRAAPAGEETEVMKIRIVYTGRSYQIAERLPAELALAEDARLDDALQAVNRLLSDDEPLSPSCLICVSGQHVGTLSGHNNQALADGDEIILIAPVAGG
jgi:molybdopterin converting factor small subunit